MRRIFLLLLCSCLVFSSAFSQVDKIKKKSNEYKKEQSDKSFNTYDSEKDTELDACTNACGGYLFDIFFTSLVKHAKFLSVNKKLYPNLFSIQIDADAGVFPTNELYMFHSSAELNWSIVGFRGDILRLFQQEPQGLALFDAYNFMAFLNLGLWDRSSFQFALGSFVEPSINKGFPEFGAKYSWFSKDLTHSVILNYNQTYGTDSLAFGNQIIYINSYLDFSRRLFLLGHLGVYGKLGLNYQRYYGENVYLFHFGINTMFYSY